MNYDQFRTTIHRRPFKPFVIHTASGEEYPVLHPEVVWQSPGGQIVIVAVKPDVAAMIDTDLISEIVFSTNQPAGESNEAR